MDPASAKLFWHVVSILSSEQLHDWAKQVITPIEESKYRRRETEQAVDGRTGRLQSMRNWIFGRREEGGEPAVTASD